MAIIQQASEFVRSVFNLCARVVHCRRVPTDDEIRGLCSRLQTANDSEFESVVQQLQRVLRRRFARAMSSQRHRAAKDESFAFRYVLRSQPGRNRAAIVDDIARNERQKTSLLLEHLHILENASKELVEDNRDLVERTKRLIAQSKKALAKRKSA